MSQLELARTICDTKVEAEAEWRLNVILDALADIYRMRAARTAEAK